jgi:RNA polymerase sigma factor (sigma-70 family)
MIAALTRIFGVHNVDLAEDVVQDAFCRAVEVWKYQGIPTNPSAWLMTAAKNRAIDVLRKRQTERTFAPELGKLLHSEWTLTPIVEELFAESIEDDVLRMAFTCCNPSLPEQSQVALILHILCGFSVTEVAEAFVSGHAATEKRIVRAKKRLGESKRLFDFIDSTRIIDRLPSVHRALYLLFNEGYHGVSKAAIRVELCHEAMRLTNLLLANSACAVPSTRALAALMYFCAARLNSRVDDNGNFVPLADQDRTLWRQDFIHKGLALLTQSASGTNLSAYHVEAAIAAVHVSAQTITDTDWKEIVELYDLLMRIQPSPIVALNRAIAVAELGGPDEGIAAISAIEHHKKLERYPFYFAALGDLECRRGNLIEAKTYFERALSFARSAAEVRFFTNKISKC